MSTNNRTNHQIFEVLNRDVIQAGLCTHCGTCVGLSMGTLKMIETTQGPLPRITGESIYLPDLALDVCPGKQINYPELYQSVFGHLPENWLTGCYEQIYIGYSAKPEIRERGASGGIITQSLVYLLDQGLINGAIVVKMGSPTPWQAEAIIATKKQEIIDCSQSVYAPIPINSILDKIEQFEGKLAYVGLPDQVASIRQLQKLGHHAALKIEYILGPYVGTNMYFESIMSYLRSNGIYQKEEISRLRYREGEWPGHLQIETQAGRILQAEKFYYNYLIPFYITKGTLYAVDFTNELTDISVGDAWNPTYEKQGKGFSVVIARSKKAQQLLEDMKDQGLIQLDDIDIDTAMSMHGHMLDFKKRGAFIRMNWRKKRGLPITEYGYRPKHIPYSRLFVELIISSIFMVCGTSVARKIVEYIPISIIGPLFNTLRKSWKNLSKPVKRKGLRNIEFEIVP